MKSWPYAVGLVGTVAAVLALALALRVWLLEVPAIGWQCTVEASPPWCVPLAGLGFILRSQAFGMVCLLIAIAAFVRSSRMLAGLAIAAGTAALVLYNAELGASAALLGALRAVRL